MVVLRCTQKLLVRLKQVGDLSSDESTTRLGDWYGNILQIGHRQMLLFISERSRLPVILSIHDAKRLPIVFPDAVCEMLVTVGIPAADIAAERSRMVDVAFGPTMNRSLLGTMNDFGFMAKVGDEEDRTRVAPGADAIPRTDADLAAGWRATDRPYAGAVHALKWPANQRVDSTLPTSALSKASG